MYNFYSSSNLIYLIEQELDLVLNLRIISKLNKNFKALNVK